MKKKLYRSRTDSKIAGVCGGLANYFGVDSTVVRTIFVLAFLFAGIGFWPYIILMIILPREPQNTDFGQRPRKDVHGSDSDQDQSHDQGSDWSDF